MQARVYTFTYTLSVYMWIGLLYCLFACIKPKKLMPCGILMCDYLFVGGHCIIEECVSELQ